MTDPLSHSSSARIVASLLLLLALYALTVLMGWPQKALALRAAAQDSAQTSDTESDTATATSSNAHAPFAMVLPFGAMLLAIAVMPLVPGVSHWWESNLHKFYVAGGLSLATLVYYLCFHQYAVPGHWPADYTASPGAGLGWNLAGTVLSNALLGEYLPFIILLFSLYTIAGGIRIEGDLPARPLTNTLFLTAGCVLANLIGTTGASMLLIRPLLETNSERKHVKHTVIFFIFIVCNCGGCLLPLGPPLFVGYLLGVPFWWTLKLWPAWLLVVGLLLVIYYLWDHFICFLHEAPADLLRDESMVSPLRFRGLWPNALLLLGVIVATAVLDPGKTFMGTTWTPWVYLREAVQLGLVVISLLSARAVRSDNRFNFAAIMEVAVLFLGIFICMQPALQIMHVCGPSLGLVTPAHFFWASGSLSSVLDNAPTYAVYFEAAQSLGGSPAVAGVKETLLAAVSLGSVFMGAMTYIGNGPNFMVKAIAESSGVKMPGFFGYIVYSVFVLLPIFVLVSRLLPR